jgi:hypothetical protein
VKVKVSYYMPGHILRASGGIASRILGNWYMKVVRLSALQTGHLYPLKILLVLVFVTVWIDSRATEWLEGLSQ